VTRQKAAVLYVCLLVVLIPFAIFPGLDEFALLPRLALFLGLTLVFAICVIKLPGEDRRIPSGMLLALLSFWAIAALSPLWAGNPFRSVYDLAKHIPAWVAFVLLARTFPIAGLPIVVTCHATAGLAVSLIGIAEFTGISPFDIPSTGRPSATFAFRNLAAAYLATGIPIAALCGLVTPTRWQRALGLAAVCTMLLFLAYTRARASWFGLLAGSCLALTMWLWNQYRFQSRIRIRPPLPAVLAIAATVALAFVPDQLAEQHTQRFDEKKESLTATIASISSPGGDRGRFAMWLGTLDMIADAPVLGVGLGNWEYIYPPYDRSAQIYASSSPHRPHNDILWIWSELGTIGLVAYLFLLYTVYTRCLRPAAPKSTANIVGLTCIASTTAFLGIGMFSFPFERVPPELNLWLAISFVFALPEQSDSGRRYRLPDLLLPALLALALVTTIRHIQFDSRYIRAHIEFRKKNYEEAAKWAAEALQYGTFDHQAWLVLGDGAYHRGDWKTSVKHYNTLLDYHPLFANGHNGLGLAAYGEGAMNEAITHYERAIEIVPRHFPAIYNKGLAFEALGEVDSAVTYYRKSYNSNYTKPYVNLGALYNSIGMVDSAISVYESAALKAYLPAIEAFYNLGNLYLEQKEFAKAGDSFLTFMNRWGHQDSVWEAAKSGVAQAYSGFGVQLESRGSIDSAFASYQKAIEFNPTEHLNWFNLGNIFREKAKHKDAIEAYTRALEIEDQHVDSYNNLGMTYRDVGNDDKALQIYRRAMEVDPENAILNFNLGQVLLVLGRHSEGDKALARFRDRWTGDPALVHFHLGNALAQANRLEEARTKYRAFLQAWEREDELRRSAQRILKSISPPTQ
jgi:tetratricopeptide (TPR) repeat protein